MDIDKLLKALDNDENTKIFHMTTSKITQLKVDMLDELQLEKHVKMDYLKKLKMYTYVDEVNDIKYGRFIRWIPISDPEKLYLSSGGIVCDIKVTDDGIVIVCKNFIHMYYQIKFDECIIFQKLTEKEKVLLNALNHLAK